MNIWHRTATLAELNEMSGSCMPGHLGVEISEIGDDYLQATMPVDQRTRQPMGILHGGASVVLAETLGSIAANMVVDGEKYYCVGQEINANHLRPVPEGIVTGTARPIHIGRRSQVWEIRITEAGGKLSCISRITMAVVAHGE
ncbi:hotdog fold thioesterase [Microbulbifer yueqingensis]|uniref:1,4-dihydroxy-2-naphthoyl-CoA hydrolase n=1 Tax=Microbulbifer yueqingensis TaxID=658219 RepID=A0A1G8Y6H2_9GAMM|nr:hotdog fold thioesterase [Microbulbifer yueqingensis]SDJ98469.1 1,4-dihydroxy-2-naphthoyl-CoA hydrolase [Microbulbifer yueqingensis]